MKLQLTYGSGFSTLQGNKIFSLTENQNKGTIKIQKISSEGSSETSFGTILACRWSVNRNGAPYEVSSKDEEIQTTKSE